MFIKHTTTDETGDLYEKYSADSGVYYRVWETENSRYIDEDNYVPYLDWLGQGNTLDTVDVTPSPVIPDLTPRIDERLDALESAFLEDLLSRL